VPETVFISYAHEDAELARFFAAELIAAGYAVWIDEGELHIGDSLVERISTGIRGAHFVLALVSPTSVQSPWCKRELSMAISSELRPTGVRVLPLCVGDVDVPPSLEGVFYERVDPHAPAASMAPILASIHRHAANSPESTPAQATATPPTGPVTEPVQIEGVIVEEVGEPRNDSSPRSALYRVPLRLSRAPSAEWAADFVATWDSPPEFTTRHRPGIASISGDRILLDGTTMDELERVHLQTLRLALEIANDREAKHLEHEQTEVRRRAEAAEAHLETVRAAAQRLRFDRDPRDLLGADEPLIVVSDLRVDPIDPATLQPSPLLPPPNELVVTIMNGGNGPGYQIQGFAHFRQAGGAWQPLGMFSPIPALPVGVTVERRFRPFAGMPWPSYVTPDMARVEGTCVDRRNENCRFGDQV
jgi:TIR domain